MRVLGESVRLRYLELLGDRIDFPEDHYQGEYIKEIAAHLKASHGDALRDEPADGLFKRQAEQEIFDDIKKTLARLGIAHDVFFNENSLYESGMVKGVIEELRSRGLAYDQEGAVWFKTSALGAEGARRRSGADQSADPPVRDDRAGRRGGEDVDPEGELRHARRADRRSE